MFPSQVDTEACELHSVHGRPQHSAQSRRQHARAGKPAGEGITAVEAELEAAAEHGYHGDPALAALAKTGDLIEQYLHPSNNGQ